MALKITLGCDAMTFDGTGTCPAAQDITADEIQQVREHPDASPRNDALDTARHIAASMGWTTTIGSGPVRDRCPDHSGRPRRRKRLTP